MCLAVLKIERETGEELTDQQLARLAQAKADDTMHNTLHHYALTSDTCLGRGFKTAGLSENTVNWKYLATGGVVDLDNKRIKVAFHS